MRKYDIVYILKANARNDELRYSLRSVVKNMEYRKIWFYCGKPEDITPDCYVAHKQIGGSKWERVRSSLIEVCKNDDITKQFWLFNDDFYVTQPMESAKNYHRGLLKDHILDIERRHGGASTGYTRQLRNCMTQLQDAGLTTLDYAIHIPMLVDRQKALETLMMFPRCPMFRSLYGNYAQIGGDYITDCKTVDPNKVIDKDAPFFSTSNRSFAGEVQRQLADMFPDACKYEDGYVLDNCSV